MPRIQKNGKAGQLPFCVQKIDNSWSLQVFLRQLESLLMSFNNDQPSEQKIDPVLPDQGGRMTASDPAIQPSPAVAEPAEETVRRKAYELYELKGRKDGEALNDWVEAEVQIRWT